MKSGWREALSSCGLDGGASSFKVVMDVVAIALGIIAFAVLFGLIYGIDRI